MCPQSAPLSCEPPLSQTPDPALITKDRRVWNKYVCGCYVENFGQEIADAQIQPDDVEEFVPRINTWRPAHTCVDANHAPCVACGETWERIRFLQSVFRTISLGKRYMWRVFIARQKPSTVSILSGWTGFVARFGKGGKTMRIAEVTR